MDFNKSNQAGIYFCTVNNEKRRTICEIYSKLTITKTERCLPMLTLKKKMPAKKQLHRKFTQDHFFRKLLSDCYYCHVFPILILLSQTLLSRSIPFVIPWCSSYHYCTTSSSAQVQVLFATSRKFKFATCRKFAMLRTSDNGTS